MELSTFDKKLINNLKLIRDNNKDSCMYLNCATEEENRRLFEDTINFAIQSILDKRRTSHGNNKN